MSGLTNFPRFWQHLTGRTVSGPEDRLEFGIAKLRSSLYRVGAEFQRGFLEEHCFTALGLPFCTPEKEHKKQQTLIYGNDTGRWRWFGMERIRLYETRRHCPACVVDDLEMIGTSYWRRTPQVVGVRYCPVHKVRTVESCNKCGGSLHAGRLPAPTCRDCGQTEESVPIDPDDSRAWVELRFADAVQGVFEGRITGPMTSNTLRDRVAGLFPGRRGLPGGILLDYLKDTVDPEFLELIGLDLKKSNRIPWPMGLCGPGVIFEDALIQLFSYALVSRDRRREEMFETAFPTDPRWLVAPSPEHIIENKMLRPDVGNRPMVTGNIFHQ